MRLGGLLRSMRSAGALSMSPTRASSVAAVCSRSPGLSNGQQKTIAFHQPALARIRARLDRLGISPTSFPWRPGDLATASPYPGLKGFETGEAALFFVRAGDIARGLAEIRKLRRTTTGQVLVIQAASGAGKSSFLKAGLWPRLSRDPEFVPLAILRPVTGILTGEHGIGRQFAAFFAARDPVRWRMLTAAAIHQELRKPDEEARAFLADLINAAAETAHAAQRMANPDAPPPTLLIAVDQAEELFAVSDLDESTRFLRLFASLIDPYREVEDAQKLTIAPQLIWTLRADSMDALLHAAGAARLKPPVLFPLPPIPRDAYQDIIKDPAGGGKRRRHEARNRPAASGCARRKIGGRRCLAAPWPSPCASLSPTTAWGAAAKLTLESFEAAGGMEGVLTARLAAAQRAGGGGPKALRRLFLPHLCTWDAEANPPGAKRLMARQADITSGQRANLAPLIEVLVDERLLTRSGNELGAITLEVAHEALLRLPPISEWLLEDREFLTWLANIARARQLEEINTGDLFFGGPMEDAKRWLSERTEDIPPLDREFINNVLTVELRRREEKARRREEEIAKQFREQEEKERQYREAELRVAKAQAEAARRVARWTAFSLASVLLALLAGGAGLLARQQQRSVEQQMRATEEPRRLTQITQSGLLANAADAAYGEGKDWGTITTAACLPLRRWLTRRSAPRART